MASSPDRQPSPMLVFETISGYQRSAALKAALELDLFTALGEGASTAAEIATRVGASERGVRILSDYLTILGFLTKQDGRYALTADSAIFLDRRSRAYVGGVAEFMLDPHIMSHFWKTAEAVRTGTTPEGGEGTMEPDHPVWVSFARGMMAMMAPAAQFMAEKAALDPARKVRILDVAAGHGLFGIVFLQRYPNAEVVAVDWEKVLDVAKAHAEQFGVADRWHAKPGSAFEEDLGEGYDIILMTNFLHHFDPETNEKLLRRVHAALADGGRVITLEFVPNEDRVTPPMQAAFALTMLVSTGSGDAFTFAEYERMFANAGFSRTEMEVLPNGAQTVLISEK